MHHFIFMDFFKLIEDLFENNKKFIFVEIFQRVIVKERTEVHVLFHKIIDALVLI